jgi:hypothetical protein
MFGGCSDKENHRPSTGVAANQSGSGIANAAGDPTTGVLMIGRGDNNGDGTGQVTLFVRRNRFPGLAEGDRPMLMIQWMSTRPGANAVVYEIDTANTAERGGLQWLFLTINVDVAAEQLFVHGNAHYNFVGAAAERDGYRFVDSRAAAGRWLSISSSMFYLNENGNRGLGPFVRHTPWSVTRGTFAGS